MLVELTKNIKLVRPEAKAMFPYSNSLFIDDEVKIMIDAGAGGKAYGAVPLEQIRLLLLTHHHFDHINGVNFFKNARIMAGKEEQLIFQDENKYIEEMGYNRWTQLMGTSLEKPWENVNMPEDVPSRPGFQAIDISGVFEDGDVFNTGSTSFFAVHTPGHSSGHYAFFFPEERILFSADLDLSMRGPWYGSESSNVDDLIASIHKLISLKPRILISSHRRAVDSGIENLLLKYLDIALQRENRILAYLTEPRSIDDIANQKFINEWEQRTEYTLFGYKMMIIKHLDRLIKNGQVQKNAAGKYLRA